jgi:hypothetical protein
MNSEYRIDLNTQNAIEETETVGEEIINQLPPTPRPTPTPTLNNEINNDHLHQLFHLIKENLTSTFPFALIIILKAFYEHSAGITFTTNSENRTSLRNYHALLTAKIKQTHFLKK